MKTLAIKVAFIVLMSAVFLTVNAQSGTRKAPSGKPASSPTSEPHPPPVLLPSQTQIDAALKRTLGYDPGLSWNILDIRPSSMPGVVEVLVSMNKQQPIHIYTSPEGQYAIIGEMIPFGPNPFEPARQKLAAAEGPGRGAQKPAIDIVEFSDLECPHCKAAAPIVEKLVTDFPQVHLVFQQFPLPASLHPWALKAAKYADCAGRMNNEAFWKYIDSIFENQGSIAEATADDKFKELATAAGLDGAKVAACAAAPEAESNVSKSLQLGQSLEVTSTPTVFINGRRVLSLANLSYDQLKVLVQFEIDHAGK